MAGGPAAPSPTTNHFREHHAARLRRRESRRAHPSLPRGRSRCAPCRLQRQRNSSSACRAFSINSSMPCGIISGRTCRFTGAPPAARTISCCRDSRCRRWCMTTATSASRSPTWPWKRTRRSARRFRTLNRCLDDAIAGAVTDGRERPSLGGADGPRRAERLGFLAHELRNLVNAATSPSRCSRPGTWAWAEARVRCSIAACRGSGSHQSFGRRGSTGPGPPGPRNHRRPEFIDELAPAATLEAANRGLRFTVHAADANVAMQADRQILAAIVANLLQNAFKFTRPRTSVSLRVIASADRVLIEIEDECGGSRTGTQRNCFSLSSERSADRTGLGLGLAFSRWGAEVNGGRISTRNLPDTGACSASTCRGCQCPFSRRRDAPRCGHPCVSF